MSNARGREFSGESHSTTMSEGLERALRYTTLTEPTGTTLLEEPEDSESDGNSAVKRLGRALSTKSVFSTASSFATRMQRAAGQPGVDSAELNVIGLGSCGTVFELPGTEIAYKKGTKELDMWRDFCLTNRVHNAAKEARNILQEAFPSSTIPRTPLCHEYHPADDDAFWLTNLPRFPASHRTRQPLFIVDRILPLPEQTRMDLIEEYFDQDESVQQEAKEDRGNKDCLVRTYLGERESTRQQSEVYDSLRNFPLRLNMMEELQLEVSELANEMAIGLAIMHWQAQVDGMDVEFVLGSSATWDSEQQNGYDDINAPPHIVKVVNFKRRAVHLWMLDFDKATTIEFQERDVDKKLVPAFLGNDPYYPRRQVDEQLWEDFCSSYLKASEVILRRKGVDERVLRLPERFVAEVLRVSTEHEDWNEEDNIVFR